MLSHQNIFFIQRMLEGLGRDPYHVSRSPVSPTTEFLPEALFGRLLDGKRHDYL